jgi:hypothetical protein
MEIHPRIIAEHSDEEMTMDILKYVTHVVGRILFCVL